MTHKKLKGMRIDIENNVAELVTLDNELEAFYKALNCEYIDIYRRKIGDRWYMVLCDDEGALKPHPIASAIDCFGQVAFYGNLLIVSGRHDEGELYSLTESEIENLKYNVSTQVKDKSGKIIDKVMLFNVRYHD